MSKNSQNMKLEKNEIKSEIKKTNKQEMTDEDKYIIDTYQKKSDIEHILDCPNSYFGSDLVREEEMWICNYKNNEYNLISKYIEYNPGLYKLFDEGLVNCRDHIIRQNVSTLPDKKMVTYINVSINMETGDIEMCNDGDGIDIIKHPIYDIWIPELVLATCRSSTNYSENKKKNNALIGGKNGFGTKLIFVWSIYGVIETVDFRRGLKYRQEFFNNLKEKGEPIITKVSKSGLKPYTKIIFRPDYKRFGIKTEMITQDLLDLFRKRTIDICALTDDKIKVNFQGETLPIKNFKKYVELYIGDNKIIYEQPHERWELIIALSPTHEFQQISFVNGICTYKGGKHIDYIMGKILRGLTTYIETKKKIKVNPNSIKEQLFLFLKCDIENPDFSSQIKDYLETPSTKFGSSCEISDLMIEKIAKMGVMDIACSITDAKENKKIAKETNSKKSKRVLIAKYEQANFAGTAKSDLCSLILCEGDSAKSGVISGLSNNDKDIFGIYPLKGKVMNVRGETTSKIVANNEITELIQILGLEIGKQYKTKEDVKKFLNYSKIIILCDADVDGSHIKGLIINLFECMWPSLILIDGFISYMNTPILKATLKRNNNSILSFYHQGEYDNWIKSNQINLYDIQYFKGLGTSTPAEFKEYFKNPKIVNFIKGENTINAIDMAFNKKRANERKLWLEAYNENVYLDTSLTQIKFEDFIDKDLIHFSIYDCKRSIPNIMDGFKPSQRKILYSAFKRNLTSRIKVAQFSGYVSEHSAYHHGEASLQGAIIGMAQNFVGSNNINLLEPLGQFGTRLEMGKDYASPRYIYTHLNPLTRLIFPQDDDSILNYLDDDGEQIEPEYYIPIIPMVLINGAEGIGTGYSFSIVSYNPKTIISYIKDKLINNVNDKKYNFIPYYNGFKGIIQEIIFKVHAGRAIV